MAETIEEQIAQRNAQMAMMGAGMPRNLEPARRLANTPAIGTPMSEAQQVGMIQHQPGLPINFSSPAELHHFVQTYGYHPSNYTINGEAPPMAAKKLAPARRKK